jgi:hypothetical protein
MAALAAATGAVWDGGAVAGLAWLNPIAWGRLLEMNMADAATAVSEEIWQTQEVRLVASAGVRRFCG